VKVQKLSGVPCGLNTSVRRQQFYQTTYHS